MLRLLLLKVLRHGRHTAPLERGGRTGRAAAASARPAAAAASTAALHERVEQQRTAERGGLFGNEDSGVWVLVRVRRRRASRLLSRR
eukprot:316853-Chlamydomonas_euryale.AAC.3